MCWHATCFVIVASPVNATNDDRLQGQTDAPAGLAPSAGMIRPPICALIFCRRPPSYRNEGSQGGDI